VYRGAEPDCGCPAGACTLGIAYPNPAVSKAKRAAERINFLLEEIARKDEALDAAISALDQLSKSGSLRRDVRESAITSCREARNERLF
jgi:hypothetical protein